MQSIFMFGSDLRRTVQSSRATIEVVVEGIVLPECGPGSSVERIEFRGFARGGNGFRNSAQHAEEIRMAHCAPPRRQGLARARAQDQPARRPNQIRFASEPALALYSPPRTLERGRWPDRPPRGPVGLEHRTVWKRSHYATLAGNGSRLRCSTCRLCTIAARRRAKRFFRTPR